MGRCRRRFTLSLSLLYYHYYYHYYYQLSIINYQLSVINYQLSIIKFYHIRLVDGPTEIRLRSRSLALFCAVRCGAVRCGAHHLGIPGRERSGARARLRTWSDNRSSLIGTRWRVSGVGRRVGRNDAIDRAETSGYGWILTGTGGYWRILAERGGRCLQWVCKPMRSQ